MEKLIRDLGVKKVSLIVWFFIFLVISFFNSFTSFFILETVSYSFIFVSSALSGMFFIIFIPSLLSAIEGKIKAEARAKEFLSLDMTTGFINKQFFLSQLKREVSSAKRYDSPFSLMMVEINNYDSIVEKHGRNTIEHVLKECGKRIEKQVRDSDVIGKYDTKHFGVILSHAKDESLEIIEKRLKKELEESPVMFKDKIFVETKIVMKEFDKEIDVDSDSYLNRVEKLL
ncbi:MAG: GGDEF domain-containing protein [Campylobacterales bacterium]|nr:GGDEF domain-containing protein [Campylobacterales bacterium]